MVEERGSDQKNNGISLWKNIPDSITIGNVRAKVNSFARSMSSSIDEEEEDDDPIFSRQQRTAIDDEDLRGRLSENATPVPSPIINGKSVSSGPTLPSSSVFSATTTGIPKGPHGILKKVPQQQLAVSFALSGRSTPDSSNLSLASVPLSLPNSSVTGASKTYGVGGGEDPASYFRSTPNPAPPPPPKPQRVTEPINRQQRTVLSGYSSVPSGGQTTVISVGKSCSFPREEVDANALIDNLSVSSSVSSSDWSVNRGIDSKLPALRAHWEQNCRREEEIARMEALRVSRCRRFSFPKWRSNDALSASLVASNSTGAAYIPADSNVPEERRRLMQQTEFEAKEAKMEIHRQVEPFRYPTLNKGKSLENINIQNEPQSWYDESKIKEAVSRESIANIAYTRQRFEFGTQSATNSRYASPQPPVNYPRRLFISESNSSSPLPAASNRGTPSMKVFAAQHTPVAPLARESRLTPEEQRFINYLRQNQHIANGLGISIPSDLLRDFGLNSLPSTGRYTPNGPALSALSYRRIDSRGDEQRRSPAHQNNSEVESGRLSAQRDSPHLYRTNSSSRFARRHEVPLDIPENRKPFMQDPYGRYGGDLIAAEMRLQQTREEELRRSRSELGLPDLEDTMELWRNGYRGLATNCLRPASSFDQGINRPIDGNHKAGSINDMCYTGRDSRSSGYMSVPGGASGLTYLFDADT